MHTITIKPGQREWLIGAQHLKKESVMKECQPKHKTYHVLMQQACTSYILTYTATSFKSLQARISWDYKVYKVKWHRIERVDYNY